MNPQRDENWISPDVRLLLQRIQRDSARIEALESLFANRPSPAQLPRPDEDAE